PISLLMPPSHSSPAFGAAPRAGESNADIPATQERAYSGHHPMLPPHAHRLMRVLHRQREETFWPRIFIQLPFASNAQEVLAEQLRAQLGKDYEVSVQPAAAPAA